MGSIEYRRAGPDDYAEIVRLQRVNYIGNLSEEERREGFLSAEFSLEQVAAIATNLGILFPDRLIGLHLNFIPGSFQPPPNPPGQELTAQERAILADPAAHLHLYGKSEARQGRKMGHVTKIG